MFWVERAAVAGGTRSWSGGAGRVGHGPAPAPLELRGVRTALPGEELRGRCGRWLRAAACLGSCPCLLSLACMWFSARLLRPGSVQPFAPAASLPLPRCACCWLRGWEGLEWVVLPSPFSKACSSPPHFLSSAPTPCKLLSSGGVPAACRCGGDHHERLFSGWGLEEGM